MNHLIRTSSLEMDEVLSLAKVICLVSCVYHTRDGPTYLTLSAYRTVSLALDQLFKAVRSVWRVIMSVENLNISYMVTYHLFSLLSAGTERTLPRRDVAQAEQVAFLVPDADWASLVRQNGNAEENTSTLSHELHTSTRRDPYTQHRGGRWSTATGCLWQKEWNKNHKINVKKYIFELH